MKRLLLFGLLALFVSLPVFAYDFKSGGIYYNIGENKTVSVTFGDYQYGYRYSGVVSIPKEVTYNGVKLSVTSIGNEAFRDCYSLTSITIPNSVTSIGACAFENCKGLTSITIPNSVTRIGSSTFIKCSGLTSIMVESGNTKYDSRDNCCAIIETASNMLITGCKNTTIPNSVTSIGSSAFQYCSDLTSITIPNSVTSIGNEAFYDCSGLTSITIPNSVTSIGYQAFSWCKGLTSITIGNSVTSIGENAFASCRGLTSIIIPNSVTSIGEEAFEECSGLTSITIPNNVTSIGNYAFRFCSNLKEVKTEIINPYNIENGVFVGISSEALLYVPSGTKEKYQAYKGWTKNFKEIIESTTGETFYTLSIKATGNGSVSYNGTSIRSKTSTFTINEGSNAIITFKPDNGYKIKSLKVNYSDVTSIITNSQYTISNIKSNTTVEVEFEAIPLTTHTLSIKATGNGSASYDGMTIRSKTSTFVLNEGANAVITFSPDNGCQIKNVKVNGTDVTERVATIGDNGNWYIDGIDTGVPGQYAGEVWESGIAPVVIGNIREDMTVEVEFETINVSSVVDINGIRYNLNHNEKTAEVISNGDKSYKGDIVIPESINYNGDIYSVTSIGFYAFSKDSGLTSITIPKSVTSIGNCAFMACYGLSSVTMSNGLVSIGSYAFIDCGITSITIPNSVTNIGDHAFEGCKSLNSVTIPGSVRNIEALTFYECSGLTSITISNGVTSIGQSAFYGCSRLNSIIIPSSVTSIDDYAFGACSNLISIKVSDDNIRYDSRNNCNAIIETSTNTIITACKNTVIPNDVISIGNHAFVGCKSLFSINIPNSVTSIGMQAFYDCSSLISITIPNSVTTIGGGAFVNCSSLNSINFPNSVTSIGNYAFSNCSNLATVISEIQNPFGIEDFVFNNISTQAVLQVPYRTKSKYEVLSGWTKNFKEIVEASGDDSFSVNGVNYSVASYDDKTVCVVNGSYGMVLEVPAKITYQNTEWTVAGIDNGALANNLDLAAIIWNPSVNFTVSVDNPNLLLYVKSASYAPSSIKNVVVNGSANSITLTDENSGNNFYCPQEFTAKTISYIHIYTMNTGMGEARGWETIALPFDVQKITHSSKGEIVPFVNRKSGDSKKPFWLMEMSGGGFIDANAIKANTPYIISMPNNAHYKNEFRLNGIVTFSAEDVKVKKSDLLSYGYFGNNSFIPNYINQKLTDALVLNVNNNYVSYNGNEAEGSHFVKNLRSLHPFEAYMTTASGARSIAIQDDMTTGIRDIIDMIDEQKNIKVFNLKGQLMKTLEGKTMDEVKRQLPSGVYIVNGQKLIIK